MEIRSGDELSQYVLNQPTATIGRAIDNGVVLSDRAVSGHHARLDWVEGILHVTDLDSLNGTQLNGDRIMPNVEYPLKDGDVISIGSFTLTVRLSTEETHIYKVPVEAPKESEPQIPDMRGRASMVIGRGSENDIRFDHPTVSRMHARITRRGTDGDYVIEDLGSTNGTFVNGERVVSPRLLCRDDVIHVGPYKLTYKPEAFSAVDESHNLRLDALHLKKFVGRGKNLLKDISLSVQPREFVAVVGGTGAGKSTLLDALNGFRPASEGKVLINGNDLRSNFDVYRTQLGYVPQQNTIHMELTPYEALDYSARLRLPADTTARERRQRVMNVLTTLGLLICKDRPIRKLSGGEQRRVSIGVELLAQPGLFFLDEATTGLDPAVERQMMHLLRDLTDQGHTVLLVTHATKNVLLCDLVVFLARDGYLAYYGPPREALTYFGVSDFDDIYDKLREERSPKAWAKLYQQSEQHKKYIEERLTRRYRAITSTTRPKVIVHQAPGAALKRVSALCQFAILSRRNLNTLLRDRVSLALMLLMAPLVGALDFLFWRPGIFAADGGDAMRAVMNLYMAAVICFLVGGLASMRWIVKEADIYRRERMVTLKIVPYVLSKIWMAVLVSMYSAGVFIVFMVLAGEWPPVGTMVPVYATLTLAILAGMLTGLLISALSPNQNVTPLLLVLVLVPQIVFGGMIPARHLGGAGQAISEVTSTKWAFESLVTISGMGVCVADPECQECTGVNIFKECEFPGVYDYYNPAIDDPQIAVDRAEGMIKGMDENYGQAFKVNVFAHWGVLLVIMATLFALVLVVLRWKDRK